MKKKIFTVLTSLTVASASVAALASCGKKNNTTTTETPATTSDVVPTTTTTVDVVNENDFYYCDTELGEYFVTLAGDKVTVFADGISYVGTITKEGDALKFTFEDANVAVNVAGDTYTLTIEGETYTLRKRETFAVTFKDGANTISTVKVVNGKAVEKIAAPEKDGYAFVGWFKDAAFTTEYDFENTPILDNATVYARYVDLTVGQSEYTVTLVDGDKTTTVETKNGVVYNLPKKTDADFLGWYVAVDGDATKLSYQYTDQKLTEGVTLVAVYDKGELYVTVTGNKIEWNALKGVTRYNIEIQDAEGNEVRTTEETATNWTFDFSKLTQGEYKILVYAGGKSGVAYKKNKMLDAVSNVNFVDDVIVFEPVAGATRYSIAVDCGNKNHNHANYNLGSQTYFDFAGCQMQEGGIKFVITAYASNYKESVSKTFILDRTLDAVAAEVVNDQLVWNRLSNAVNYVVEVTKGDDTEKYEVGNVNSFDLRYFTGDLKLSVYAVRTGYNSTVTEVAYKKDKLVAPTNVKLVVNKLTWDAVEGAASYNVMVNGEVTNVTATEFEITNEMVSGDNEGTYSIQAVAEDAANNSEYSYEGVINRRIEDVAYTNGNLVWDEVYGAVKYGVKVNDGTEVFVTTNTCPVELTMSGSNKLSVRYYDDKGVAYAEKAIYVQAEEVRFVTAAGADTIKSMYKVVGDPLTLPTAAKYGQYMDGWYTLPNGSEEGGVKVEDGFKMPNKTLVLYAYWTNMPVKVTLADSMYGSVKANTAIVRYKETYTLEAPELSEEAKYTYAFVGWYTQPNGAGVKLTDETGKSVTTWRFVDDTTVYPYYQKAIDYEVIEVKGNTYLEAKPGAGVKYVKTINIASSIDGVEVYRLGAFKSDEVKNVTVLNIPDSITVIDTDLALKAFTYLEYINVYDSNPDVAHQKNFVSSDGVLYAYDQANVKELELAYIPAKNNKVVSTLTILDGCTTIPEKKVYAQYYYTKVIIPNSVKLIAKDAFASCTGLLSVEFAETKDDSPELIVEEGAFKSCSKLTEITLPKRLAKINYEAFTSCSALERVNCEEGSTVYTSKDGMLCTNSGTELVYCPKGRTDEVTIPAGVSKIKEGAFKSNTKITKVIIPGTVTLIEQNAFNGCSGITEIEFKGESEDDSLEIGESAFYGAKLVELTLAPNVRTIGKNAFGGATTLLTVNVNTDKTVDFAKDICAYTAGTCYVNTVNIGKDTPAFDVAGAFAGSSDKLATVNVDANNPNFASVDGVLFNKAITELLFYPASDRTEYAVPDTVTRIGDRIFQNKTALVKFTIGKQIVEIGEEAFYGCSGIKELVFEQGRKDTLTIGNKAFQNCSKLEALVLPDDVVVDAEVATYAGVVSIGDYAFAGCSTITSVVLPEGLTTIGDFAFNSCSSLQSVSIPSTLETFGKFDKGDLTTSISSFDNCKALKTITVSDKNKDFAGKNGLILLKNEAGIANELVLCAIEGDVVIPKTVSVIRDRVFYNNATITSVSFEDNMSAATQDKDGNWVQGELQLGTTVGKGYLPVMSATLGYNTMTYTDVDKCDIFYYCTSMTSCELPGVKELPYGLFYNCTSLKNFTVPNTVEKIRINAFYNCTALTGITFEEGNDEKELVLEDGGVLSGDYGTTSTYSPFGNTRFEEITLPSRCKKISDGLFAYNTYIKKVNVPAKLEKIGYNAFYNATSLTDIDLSKTAVTDIEAYAFAYTKLTSITLPETLKNLGSKGSWSAEGRVFNNSAIEELVIPASVEKLYGYSFYYMTKLKKITFAEGSKIKEIPTYCFNSTAIEEITIPASVETIGASAFYNATKLKTVTFEGTNLHTIGNEAFRGTVIEEFTFPLYKIEGKIAPFTSIGTSLFSTDKALTKVNLSESNDKDIDKILTGAPNVDVLTIVAAENPEYYGEYQPNFAISDDGAMLLTKDKTQIMYVFKQLPETYTLPASLKVISDNAFLKQKKLKEVTIPKSVISIGSYAFSQCISLKKVIFEEGSAITGDASANDIGKYAFYRNPSLETVVLPESLKAMPQYMFANCPSLKNVTIPEGFTTFGTYAFAETGLEEVVLPSTVTTLADNTFYRCRQLKKINLDKVTLIGGNVFQDCFSLQNVTFSEGLTQIGATCFKNCKSLTELTLPGSLADMSAKSSQFAGCTSLKKVTFGEGITYLGVTLFQDCTSLTDVTFASTMTDFYDSVKKAAKGKGTFQGCTALKNITLPETITLIPETMFKGCTSLETIEIPEGVKVIGNNAFQESGLKSILLPAGLVSLGGTAPTQAAVVTSTSYGVFMDCASLTNVTFTGGGTAKYYVGAATFKNCTALTDVTFTKMANCGANTFEASGIKTIDIANVSVLGASMFVNCASLTDVSFAISGVTQLPNYMFQGCTALKEVELPSCITQIGTYTFKECTALAKINLEKVKTIDTQAFIGCTSLEEVDLSACVTKLNTNAFKDCTSLKKVTLSNSTKIATLGTAPFLNCTSLTDINFAFQLTKQTTIASGLFQGMGIEEITIPKNITSIAASAFKDCANLKTVTFEDGRTSNLTVLVSAFENCTALTTVNLVSKITQIGNYAFRNTGLTGEVVIPSTVTTLGYSPFGNTEATIKLADGNTTYEQDENGIIWKKTGTPKLLVFCPSSTTLTEYEVPTSVQINQYAFEGCKSIKKITCSADTKVSANSFNGSYAEEIVFPTTAVMNMGTGTIGLKKAIIPEGCTTITSSSFSDSSVEEVVLPSTVTKIDSSSFLNCENLTTINIPAAVNTINGTAFKNCTSLKTLVFPEIEEGTITIAANAFENCGFEELTITTDKLRMATNVFANNVNLKKVTFADSIESILSMSSSATANVQWFKGCTALEEIKLGENVTDLPIGFFAWTGITSVTLPKGIKTLPNYTFQGCANLKSFDFTGLESDGHGTYLFEQSGIEEVIFPEGFLAVPNYSFQKCANLKTVVLPESLTTLGSYCLAYSGLTSITLPENIVVIDTYTFRECLDLEEITIKGKIQKLGSALFHSDTKLKKIVIDIDTENFQSMIAGLFTNLTEETTVYFTCSKQYLDCFCYDWDKDCTCNFSFNYNPEI